MFVMGYKVSTLLTKVEIPSTLTSIGKDVVVIVVDDDNDYYLYFTITGITSN